MADKDTQKRTEAWLKAQYDALPVMRALGWRNNVADTLHRQRGERMVKEALAAEKIEYP